MTSSILLADLEKQVKSTNSESKFSLDFNERKGDLRFLPSIGETAKFFGIKNSSDFFLSLIEEECQVSLDIKKPSRYALLKKGVGKKIANAFFDWFKSLPIPIEKIIDNKLYDKVKEYQQAGSYGGDWIIGAYSANYKKSRNYKDELTPVLDFLAIRCDEDFEYLSNAKREIKANNIQAQEKLLEVALSCWDDSKLIEQRHVENYKTIVQQYSSAKTLSSEQALTSSEAYFSLYLDFYFHFIAAYEVGCILCFTPSKSEAQNKKGILNRAIKSYSGNIEVKSCFHGLLNEFSDVISKTSEELTQRKMATFIPIERSHSSDQSLEDRQYNRLKEWRKSKNLPSDKLLREFLDNMATFSGKEVLDPIVFLSKIAIALDKNIDELFEQIIKEREDINPQKADEVIRTILGTYPKYYQYHFDKHIDNFFPE